MPNANKYIIDVANIRPGGRPIKGLYVGSSEKKYATLGSKCIYDKVLYELSVNDITNVEPNAQTVTFTYTSKKTHGNGSVDTLYINPSTKQITANTSTASTKGTTVVVNQALTLDGTTTGTGVTVTITQKKDYPTGITLSITPNSTIPAAGGYITTALTNYTYSVKAAYKSGNSNVDVTASSTISANVTGVTAGSKGTTASTATVAGTIRFTASYTCNGVTKTSAVDVNIMQDKNEVVAYANPTFTLSPGNTTLPASGGSVTGSVSAIQQVRTWSSTSTDTITPASTTAWTAQTISCESRGTVTGDTLTLGTTKVTVTANGKSTSKSYVVYQQANAITAYSKPTGLSLSCADIPAGGGTVTAATGGTVSQTRTYTSKATDTINPTVSITWDPAQTARANSLETTDKARTKITTLTATYSANGQSNSTSVDVYQQANEHADSWNDPVVTITYATFSAAGETKTPTMCSATQSGTRTWTSGSQTGITNTSFTWGNYSMTNGNGFTLNNATTGEVKADGRGTTEGAARSSNSITRTATGAGNKQGTGSVKATQEANAVTNSNTNPFDYVVSVSIGNGLTAAGGSATVTASASHKAYNTYTSTAVDTTAHTVTDTAIWEITTNGNNRFSKNGNTLSHNNMTTNITTDTVVVTATNSSKTSVKATDTKSISNTRQHEGDTPSNYVATISIGNGITAAGGSATVTASASHTNIFTWVYTSGSKLAGQTETKTDTATVTEDSDPNNRFSYSNGTLTHSSMGTTATTDTCTLRVRNASNTATTNTDSVSVQNRVESTEWNYPVVTLSPTSLSFTSDASSKSITASATQSGVNTYTSNATANTSNTSFTWEWTKNGSWITVGSSGTNTKAISVTANTSTFERSGSVSATALGAGSKTNSKSAPVSQAGAQSKLTPRIISIDATVVNNDPPTPTNYINVICFNQTVKNIYFGIATGTTSSSIVSSGYVTTDSTETACDYRTTNGQKLYLFLKVDSGTLTCNMGSGSGPKYNKWINGREETGTMTNVTITSSWSMLPGATYIDTWTGSVENTTFYAY